MHPSTFTHYIKDATRLQFFAVLKTHLERGYEYAECSNVLRQYFTTPAGRPNGVQLRDYVNNMVDAKLAPQEFITWWDKRKGARPPEVIVIPAREPAVEVAQPRNALVDLPPTAEVSEPATIVSRVETFNGWPVSFVDGEPLIEDEELGRRLGYDRPADVRKLISRIFSESEVIATVAKTSSVGGRPARVVLLTERQALKVCLRSETDRASAVQDEVIEVFLAVRHGKLVPSAIDPILARVLEGQTAISGQLAGKLLAVEAKVQEVASTKADRSEVEQVASAVELAQRKAEESVENAEEAVSLVADVERRVAASEADMAAVKKRVDTISQMASGQKSRPKPQGWRSFAEAARVYGLPTEGKGKRLISTIVDKLSGVGRGLVVTYDNEAGLATQAMAPKLFDELGPYARMLVDAMNRHGWRVSIGSIEPIAQPPLKPWRTFEWIRDNVLMPSLSAMVAGRPLPVLEPIRRPVQKVDAGPILDGAAS